MVPALLTEEGRAASGGPAVVAAFDQLLHHHRLAAIADLEIPGTEVRTRLAAMGLGEHFESVGTSTDFRRGADATTVRRLAQTTGVSATETVVVTGRELLAKTLREGGIAAVTLGVDAGYPDLAAAIERLSS